MTIIIKTAIHSGIYASQGGGATHERFEMNTNPRNLLTLAAQCFETARSATAGYGNIGHCGTWLEIDGVRIDAYDLSDLAEADAGDRYTRSTSRTEKARALIGYVQSGSYATCRAAADAATDDYLAAL